MTSSEPPGWVYCPRTGRRWPAIKRFELKTCVLCGGFIDIRVESWKGDGKGGSPQHPGPCPSLRVVQATVETPALPDAPAPKPMTGAEIIAAQAMFKDTVYDAWLNDPARTEEPTP